jgi:anti-sigma regulatory factor (Ser/Thr protein kinase)
MATVELAFTPLPAHVRTARLIATAVARRAGITESLLDEVRLAVGEACSRAVEAHRQHCPGEPVRLELSDDDGRFQVVVTDNAPGDEPAADGAPSGPAEERPEPGRTAAVPEALPANFGLAVIAGLADDVEVSSTDRGLRVRMSWPAMRSVPVPP